MTCPHCQKKLGHYSIVEYRCIDNTSKRQAYWFCHSCARLVYDNQPAYVPPAASA